MRRRMSIAAACALACLGAAGVWAQEKDEGTRPTAPSGGTSGPAQRAPGSRYVGRLLLGDDGPEFELPASDGTQMRMRSVRGLEAMTLLFLQRPDRDLAAYAQVGDALRQRGVRVVFVCAERDPRSARSWSNFWLLYDRRGEVARRYGALDVITGNTVPAVFVLDRKGRVRYLAAGSLPSAEDLQELVLDVLRLNEAGS